MGCIQKIFPEKKELQLLTVALRPALGLGLSRYLLCHTTLPYSGVTAK
jgi:hypothetical protein